MNRKVAEMEIGGRNSSKVLAEVARSRCTAAEIDDNDNVENINSNGVLKSITSRGGVAQAISSDASGKLSRATDILGHRLALTHDTQNRLTSVMRQ